VLQLTGSQCADVINRMLLLAEGVSMGVATKLKCSLLRYSKFSTAGKC